jgi:hypothetical protein
VVKTGDPTIPDEDASARNLLQVYTLLAIDADMERHALLYRSVKYRVLILAKRERPGVLSLWIYYPFSVHAV